MLKIGNRFKHIYSTYEILGIQDTNFIMRLIHPKRMNHTFKNDIECVNHYIKNGTYKIIKTYIWI